MMRRRLLLAICLGRVAVGPYQVLGRYHSLGTLQQYPAPCTTHSPRIEYHPQHRSCTIMGWFKKVEKVEIEYIDPMSACGSIGPTVLVVVAVLFIAVVIYSIANIVRNWDKRIEELSKAVFDAVDVDKNGCIDAKEVEIAVWQLYFKVNKFVKVNPPTRDVIRAYLVASDIGGASRSQRGLVETDVVRNTKNGANDGVLDKVEFAKFAKILVGTALQRAGTMLVATLLCPFLASAFVDICIILGSKIDSMFESSPATADDCLKAIAIKMLPFMNEQLADTAASVLLISVGVPMLFSWYDSYFPTKHIAGQLKVE